jgi:hypothetical protein
MGDQEHPAYRLIVECRKCRSDSVYLIQDAESGIRLAGRDFERVKSAVLEGAALLPKGNGDLVYIFQDAETGIRLAGRDFEKVRSAVLEAAALLPEGDALASENVESASRPRRPTLFVGLPRALVLFAPVFLCALLLVASLRPYAQIPHIMPEGGSVFRSLRLAVVKADQALQSMEPQSREELQTSIRSIVASLKPFADEIRPLFEDGLGKDDANRTGQANPKGARFNP